MKFRVWMATGATAVFEFEIDESTLPEDPDDRMDEIREHAYNNFPGVSLCHQCSREVDLGDFEIGDHPEDIQEIE